MIIACYTKINRHPIRRNNAEKAIVQTRCNFRHGIIFARAMITTPTVNEI